MHIQFSCTGGIANLHLAFQADTDILPKEIAMTLLDLIKQSNLLDEEPNKEDNGSPFGADAFSYQLKIENGKKKIVFSFTDVTAPNEVRPLLDYLRSLAIAEKMKE